MKLWSLLTFLVGSLWALFLPSILQGQLVFYNFFVDTRFYMHIIGIGIAFVFAALWWFPFAQRVWPWLLGAQGVALAVLFYLIRNPYPDEILTVGFASVLFGVVGLVCWMGPIMLGYLITAGKMVPSRA